MMNSLGVVKGGGTRFSDSYTFDRRLGQVMERSTGAKSTERAVH